MKDYEGLLTSFQQFQQESGSRISSGEPQTEEGLPKKEGVMSVEEAISTYGNSQIVDTSGIESYKKASQTTEGIVGGIAIRAAALAPGIGPILANDGVIGPQLSASARQALFEQHDKDIINSMKEMSYEERKDFIRDRKQEIVKEHYSNVISGGWSELAGKIGGSLDITSLTPAGYSWKQGAAIGSVLAGTDAYLATEFEQGNADWETVAISAAGGAVLGSLFGALATPGRRSLSTYLSEKIGSRSPINEEEVMSIVQANLGKESVDIDISTLVRDLNSKFKLSEKSKLSEAVSDVNKLITSPKELEKTVSLPDTILSLKSSTTESSDVIRDALEKAKSVVGIELEVPKTLTIKGQTKLGKSPSKTLLRSPDSVWTLDTSRRIVADEAESFSAAFKELEESIPTGSDGTVPKELIEAFKGTEEITGKPVTSKKDVMDALISKNVPWKNSTAGQKMYTEVGRGIKDWSKPFSESEVKFIMDSVKPDSSRLYMKPETWMQSLGDAGKEVAERIRRSFEEVHGILGDNMLSVNKTFREMSKSYRGSADELNMEAVNILRNPKNIANASKEALTYAKEVRKVLNGMVKKYADLGLITKDAASDLIRKSKTEGYFPRVYDHTYLATDKGRKEFISALEGHNWSEREIEKVFKRLLDEDFRKATGIVKQKDGSYKLSKGYAKKIFDKRNMVSTKKTSNHMEKDRTLDIPDSVLEPFLVNDIQGALLSYLTDTGKRLAFARNLGKEGEVIAEFKRSLNVATGRDNIGDRVLSIYHHAIGSVADSKVRESIESVSNPTGLLKATQFINNVETFKLILAPIANSVQALVAGSVLLSRQTGSFSKTVKVLAKGVKESLKFNSEAAERSGAAIEQTIMKVNADLGDSAQKWSTTFLQAIQFNRIEKVQRVLAYNLGKAHTEDLLAQKSRLLAQIDRQGRGKILDKELKRINSSLDELGINTDLSPGSVPVSEMERAAQRFSNTVNFVRDADQLPLAWQSPYASLFTKFKTFSFWWGSFIKKNVYDAAVRDKNFKPAMVLMGATYAGSGVEGVRDYLKELAGKDIDKEDRSFLKARLDGLMAIGGLGLFADIVRSSAEYGPGFGLSSILGPGISDSLKLATEGVKAAGDIIEEQDFESAGKRVVRGASAFAPPLVSDKMRQAVEDGSDYSPRTRKGFRN